MQEHIEAALAALGLKATGGGAMVSILGWLFSSAAAAWFGAWIAVAGLLLNAHYTRKRDQREQREFEARMKGLQQ